MARLSIILVGTIAILAAASIGFANETDRQKTKDDVTQRFAKSDVKETPDFQRHVVPVLSRLGCNGRACHGSFQGRGGFQLSLFGYDFDADHKALLEKDAERVMSDDVEESLILAKPTDADEHGGGKRFDQAGWQYHLLRNWIAGGAEKHVHHHLVRLEVTPKELWFNKAKQNASLKAVAVWADGSREDVTPLCRFKSNDSQIATIDRDGQVTSGTPGDSHVVVFYDKAVVPISVVRPVSEKFGKHYPKVPTPTTIDELVVAKWKKLGLVPSELSDDAMFLRRVSLDLTGSLPSPKEIDEFLSDSSPSKRRKKIDELLETPAYAAWWATKINDFTGNSPRQLNVGGANAVSVSRQWYQWVYERVEKNVPYDQLVEGIVTATSRNQDESYYDFCQNMSQASRDPSGKKFAERECLPYYWQRRGFRDGNSRAISFAHSFLGIRIQCAQCHKHPFDQWTKNDFKMFAQMFTSVNSVPANRVPADREDYDKILKELGIEKNTRINGMVRQQIRQKVARGGTAPFDQLALTPPRPLDRNRNRNRRNRNRDNGIYASILGGEKTNIRNVKDPRSMVMEWLRESDNPYFARAFVNRVWAIYFNVGIVTPTDDLSLANPPSNRALFDYLAVGFVESGYDMKWLHREIVNSRTYQLSWKPNETNRRDERNFSRAVPRRIPAEVVFDSITAATGNDALIESRRQDLAGRATAYRVQNYRYRPNNNNRNRLNINAQFALSIFGMSSRENSCDCDRSMDPSLLQTVYLQNDRDIHLLIDRRDTGWLAQIVDEHAPKTEDGRKIDPRQIQKMSQRLQNVRKNRDKLRNQKGKEKQVQKLNRQLQEGYKQIAEMRKQYARSINPELDEQQVQHVIRQAYLRTLSRNPSTAEMQRCVAYVQDDPNKLNAVRGIIWALINTKEFIVNH